MMRFRNLLVNAVAETLPSEPKKWSYPNSAERLRSACRSGLPKKGRYSSPICGARKAWPYAARSLLPLDDHAAPTRGEVSLPNVS